MLIAAIGDIHGNLPALEAVLKDIDEAGIQTIVNTGDCVVGSQWPDEVVEILRSRGIVTVQGEYDRLAARFERKKARIEREFAPEIVCQIRATSEAMSSGNLEFLAGLPREKAFTVDGVAICLCHGTPQGQGDSLYENDEPRRFRRIREAANAEIIICGRTHTAFSRIVDNTLFANPGSVGVGTAVQNQAQYALISTESEPWGARILSVRY